MSNEGASSGGSSDRSTEERKKEKSKVSRTSLILWHTHQNDPSAVRKLLEEDERLVNARDYDHRMPLHVAALQGWIDVARCLLEHGADVNAQDRWGNTPLADAEGAKKYMMIEVLKTYGGLSYGKNGSHFDQKPIPPPLPNKCDWEIDPSELDFSTSTTIGKGDLHQYLKEKGPLGSTQAINFALDIARGMAYLHKEPNVIIHRDLKPRNILLVNASADHLKVGDFGLKNKENERSKHCIKIIKSRDKFLLIIITTSKHTKKKKLKLNHNTYNPIY
ncbi:hypothetical protein LUZ60_006758 [Juncus effusus]|nr:hypothetical protein LUZ60_006758 [Juncus effusus]